MHSSRRRTSAKTESLEIINAIYARQKDNDKPSVASASPSYFQNEVQIENEINFNFMAAWCIKHNISDAAANELLEFLSTKLDGLPKNIRTLKNTPFTHNFPPSNHLLQPMDANNANTMGLYSVLTAMQATLLEIKQEQIALDDRLLQFRNEDKAVNARLMAELCSVRQELSALKRLGVHGAKSPSILPLSPFRQKEDFLRFDASLDDEETMQKFKLELKQYKTKNTAKFMRMIWKRILSDDVAKRFSWRGTVDKPSIRGLNSSLAIRYSIIHEIGGEEDDFSKGCKAFFQYAQNRLTKKNITKI